MANPRTTFLKRQRERKKEEKRQEKARKRANRKYQKPEEVPPTEDGVDPDIAHIVPGPQPVLADDEDEEEVNEKKEKGASVS